MTTTVDKIQELFNATGLDIHALGKQKRDEAEALGLESKALSPGAVSILAAMQSPTQSKDVPTQGVTPERTLTPGLEAMGGIIERAAPDDSGIVGGLIDTMNGIKNGTLASQSHVVAQQKQAARAQPVALPKSRRRTAEPLTLKEAQELEPVDVMGDAIAALISVFNWVADNIVRSATKDKSEALADLRDDLQVALKQVPNHLLGQRIRRALRNPRGIREADLLNNHGFDTGVLARLPNGSETNY